MRRSTELNNSLPINNFEGHGAAVDREQISRHLGELIGRHRELSSVADSHDTDTLQDMRRIRAEIRLAQFSLKHPDYHAA